MRGRKDGRKGRATVPATTAARTRGWLLALIVLGALVFSNGISAPFLFDDHETIVSNSHIRQLWPLSVALSPPRETAVAGRPVVNLSFAINYVFAGLDPARYRVVNIALHLLAALTLFGVVRRTLELSYLRQRFGDVSIGLGWVCAAVWMLHPLQTEAVNYLSQRTELLMGLCYLLTIYCSARALPEGLPEAKRREDRDRAAGRQQAHTRLTSARRWAQLAIGACVAGMACKEAMVTAPVMVVLYDRVFAFDSFREAFRARRRLYFGLAGSWVVLAMLMASSPRTTIGFSAGTSSWTYFLNQLQMLAQYMRLTVWPRALVLDYGLPQPLALSDVLPQAVFVTTLGVAALFALLRWPRLGFLAAWCFVTLAPTSSVVPIVSEVGAERRMYVPLAGLVVLAVVGTYLAITSSGVRRLTSEVTRSRLLMALPALTCAALALGTMFRNREYESRLSVAQTIVERWPSGRGYFLLANELIQEGRRTEAMAALRASASNYAGAHYALATELAADGRFDEAVIEAETFLEAQPNHSAAPLARDLLGRALLAMGQRDRAVVEFDRLLARHPDYPARNNIRELIDQIGSERQ